MDFIYSMSAQRGQGAPEILYFTDTYEKAIIYYYEFIKINSHSTQRGQKINDNEEYEVEFYQLSKYIIFLICQVNEAIYLTKYFI